MREIMVNLIFYFFFFFNMMEVFLGYFLFVDFLYWSVKIDKRDDLRGEF